MLAYRCNVEFILSIIVFCFKILGMGALFGHNMLIFFFFFVPARFCNQSDGFTGKSRANI